MSITNEELTQVVSQCEECPESFATKPFLYFHHWINRPKDQRPPGCIVTFPTGEIKCLAELLVSVHGIEAGDYLEIDGEKLDILGPGPDFTFDPPLNIAAMPFTANRGIRIVSENQDVSHKMAYICDDQVRNRIYEQSNTTFYVKYEPYEFSLDRGVLLDAKTRRPIGERYRTTPTYEITQHEEEEVDD